MSRSAASSPGSFADRVDAKYVSLALLAGLELATVTITLARGDLSVTL